MSAPAAATSDSSKNQSIRVSANPSVNTLTFSQQIRPGGLLPGAMGADKMMEAQLISSAIPNYPGSDLAISDQFASSVLSNYAALGWRVVGQSSAGPFLDQRNGYNVVSYMLTTYTVAETVKINQPSSEASVLTAK